MFKHKRVAIDFDGTLFEDCGDINDAFENGAKLIPISNADYVTRWLKDQDFEILIFTCRPDYHRKYMEGLLSEANISFDYILFYTKPRVDLYIDDKGFRFQSWDATKNYIEKELYSENKLIPSGQNPNSDFEKLLRSNRLKTFCSLLGDKVSTILDYGCGPGLMEWKQTNYLVDGFEIHDEYVKNATASKNYKHVYDDIPNLKYYDAVMLSGVLEHVSNDIEIVSNLAEIKYIFVTVPNASSLHRHIGVDMGILKNLHELSHQDYSVGHKRYYDISMLSRNLSKALGATHKISYRGSNGLKFGSNAQMRLFDGIFDSLSNVGNKFNICGEENFSGAELIMLWEKK